MKCRYCNAEIEKDAQFCPNCGKDLSKFNRCVECGELLDNDTVFCPHCGTEQPHKEVEEESTYSKKWMWILLPLLIASGIGLWYYMSNGNSTNNYQSMTETVDTDSIAVPPTMTDVVDTDSIAVIDESDIDTEIVPLISITKLRNTEIANIEKQGFSKTTIAGHGGSETDIWYKNCSIGNRGEVKNISDNSCIVEIFDGMGASVRITVFDKNVYEQIKTDVLKYSTKSNAGYCFKWGDDEEPTNSVINMGDSEWREGGYYIDIPLY